MGIFKYWRTTTTLTGNEVITHGGRVYKANAAAGAQTHAVTAPGSDGRELYVIKSDSSANAVTLTLHLDGAASQTLTLTGKGDSLKLYDDGTTWTVLRPPAAVGGDGATGVTQDTDGVYYPSSTGSTAIVADTDGVYYPA